MRRALATGRPALRAPRSSRRVVARARCELHSRREIDHLRTSIPAIVTAGDRKASRAIYGESKAYLVVAGRPLVAHVVATLQAVPEVSEVWVVGNAARLEPVLGDPALRSALRKPLHLVGQFRSLYENGWETYRRALPGAPPDGPRPDAGRRARAVPVHRPPVRDAARDLRVHPALARDRRRLRGGPGHRRVDARVLPGSARQGRHPHGLLQSARGPLPPEQPAPDPARPRDEPQLRRGDVRAPPPARVLRRSSGSRGGSCAASAAASRCSATTG